MASIDPTSLLAGLPTWVQVSANLGMFVVAVAVSSYGFVLRLRGKPAVTPEVAAYASGVDKLEHLGAALDALVKISEVLSEVLDLMKATAREEEIEREVERRIEAAKARKGSDNQFRMDKEMRS